MFSGIASLLSAGALGAFLKIAAALFQGWMDASQRKHERLLARHQARAEMFYGPDAAGATFTRWTRRVLAFSIVWSFCAILLAFAWWPEARVLIINTDETSFRLLWGFIEIPRTAKPVEITTGGVVWAAMHWVTMILTAYFMPIGKK